MVVCRPCGVFVGTQTRLLAAAPGLDVRVVSPRPWPPFPLHYHPRYRRLRNLPQQEVWQGVPVFRPRFTMLPGLSGAGNPASIERAVRPVLAQLQADGFRPDVIDAEFFYPDGPAAARLAAVLGVPFSIKARGADIHYWATRPACRRLMLEAAAQAGGLLAVSAALKQDMVALGMAAEKIAVHYTGVDLAQFHPRDRTSAKSALGVTGPLVVSLGALIPRKGHDIVIDAIAQLPGVSLWIVGTGGERRALHRQVAARGISARVRFLGSIPHVDLPDILAAADVMALASRREGLANAWVEAMACGTPVVTPAVDGAAEAIVPPNHAPLGGRLLAQRTAPAMAEAIAALLAAPPSPQDVRRNAERFSWERNTQKLIAHLRALS
jgi:glycosyltransferase involved in cell wall biosynthesis